MALQLPSAAQQLGPLWAQQLELLRRRGELQQKAIDGVAKIAVEAVMAYFTKGASLGITQGMGGKGGASGSGSLLSGIGGMVQSKQLEGIDVSQLTQSAGIGGVSNARQLQVLAGDTNMSTLINSFARVREARAGQQEYLNVSTWTTEMLGSSGGGQQWSSRIVDLTNAKPSTKKLIEGAGVQLSFETTKVPADGVQAKKEQTQGPLRLGAPLEPVKTDELKIGPMYQ